MNRREFTIRLGASALAAYLGRMAQWEGNSYPPSPELSAEMRKREIYIIDNAHNRLAQLEPSVPAHGKWIEMRGDVIRSGIAIGIVDGENNWIAGLGNPLPLAAAQERAILQFTLA